MSAEGDARRVLTARYLAKMSLEADPSSAICIHNVVAAMERDTGTMSREDLAVTLTYVLERHMDLERKLPAQEHVPETPSADARGVRQLPRPTSAFSAESGLLQGRSRLKRR